MAELILKNGMVCIVDEIMLPEIMKFKWHACNCGGKYYVKRRYKDEFGVQKTILLHRFIMNESDRNIIIDHISGDTLDNRVENLRRCSHAENCRNSIGFNAKSGYKGVKASKLRWRAYITVSGSEISLGAYDDKDSAARAYNIAALEYFGEFARPNNICDGPIIRSTSKKLTSLGEYKGVSGPIGRGRFYAKITRSSETFYLGSFSTSIDAARAYDAKAIELYGPEYHKFVNQVFLIVRGDTDFIKGYLGQLYGYGCVKCGSTEYTEVDHIVGVKQGGARSWLSNYRILCRRCHAVKSGMDRRKPEAVQQICLNL